MADLNYTNLSPNYTSDPQLAGTSLAQMQQELASAQANPSDPNSAYYIQQLTPAIAEQQNILKYDKDQSSISPLTDQLNKSSQFLSKYSNDNNGMMKWLKDTQGGGKGFGGSANQQDISNWQAAMGNAQWQVQNLPTQINQSNKGLATDQAAITNNLNFAQPNFNQANRDIDTTFGSSNSGNPTGLYGSLLKPELQNIYQTAYDNKTGTMDELISAGMGTSGAAQKAKGNIDSQALNKSVSALGDFNNAQAQAHNNLNSQQQQQQASYQSAIDSAKGQGLGSLLAGSGNALNQSFNNNTQAITQNAINGAESNLASKRNSDNFLSGIGSAIGGLAGTALGGPIGGAIGATGGGLI